MQRQKQNLAGVTTGRKEEEEEEEGRRLLFPVFF
jgi:hypothetical protein